jgi:hypothetical protein
MTGQAAQDEAQILRASKTVPERALTSRLRLIKEPGHFLSESAFQEETKLPTTLSYCKDSLREQSAPSPRLPPVFSAQPPFVWLQSLVGVCRSLRLLCCAGGYLCSGKQSWLPDCFQQAEDHPTLCVVEHSVQDLSNHASQRIDRPCMPQQYRRMFSESA